MNFREEVSFSVLSAQHIPWKKCSVKTDGRPYSALVLRLGSDAKLCIGDKILLSNSNDITYMPANTPYSATYSDDGEMIFIHFTESVPFFSDVQNFSTPHLEHIYSLFSKLVSVYGAKRQNYKIESASVFLQIIAYLSTLKSSMVTNTSFEKAINILKDEYTNSSLTIAEVCQRANISSSYLRKLFNEEFGMSPIRYLNELRIDHAQKMLYTSYCTVEKAAWESGFSDYRYFSRVTKKLRGCTPSMLRSK